MCACACVGELMVDVLWHQGIPLKGQLCIRTEFQMKRKEKRRKAKENRYSYTYSVTVCMMLRAGNYGDRENCCVLKAKFSVTGHNPKHQCV